MDDIRWIRQRNGATLSYSLDNEIPIIKKDEFYFKNMSRSGTLEIYEDWRLSPQERAKDLVKRLSPAQLAGLMVCSCAFAIPADERVVLHGRAQTYQGKPYRESGAKASDLSDQLREVVHKERIRCIYVGGADTTEDFVEWVNNLQRLAESMEWGIPVSCATDPRHGVDSRIRENFKPGEDLSLWPDGVALAAAFDCRLAEKCGQIQARECRALGITHLLGPQIDLGTDPRWSRYGDTFGEDAALTGDLARAYIDGCQTTCGEGEEGWGSRSVVCVVKHWPGGGTGEGGRDAHYNYGKFGVYPGNNMEEHLKPFLQGAFRLKGPTKCAASVMPYYLVPYGQTGENVACGFNRHIVRKLLLETYGYQGVVCSDWEILTDQGKWVNDFAGKCWGVEKLSERERCLKALEAGIDQFGGLNTARILLEAWKLAREQGDDLLARFRGAAEKILVNMFRLGLFENPYLNLAESRAVLKDSESRMLGREAQKKSVVMLKNKNHLLPLKEGTKIYIPSKYNIAHSQFQEAEGKNFFRRYFEVVEDIRKAECAVVFMDEPKPYPDPIFACYDRGYSREDQRRGGNGYVPISLQYRPYQAKGARKHSIAGGDPLDQVDRSYYGKTVANIAKDLDTLESVYQKMQGKPVIVVLRLRNPCCVHEIEPYADVILLDMKVEKDIFPKLCVGGFNPSGLLPFQLPRDMEDVEGQMEDVSGEMECYVDEMGNRYDFSFGMNFHGVIWDERREQYKRKKRGE